MLLLLGIPRDDDHEQGRKDRPHASDHHRRHGHARSPLLRQRGRGGDQHGRGEGDLRGGVEQGVQCAHQVLCPCHCLCCGLFSGLLGLPSPCDSCTCWPPQEIFSIKCVVVLCVYARALLSCWY